MADRRLLARIESLERSHNPVAGAGGARVVAEELAALGCRVRDLTPAWGGVVVDCLPGDSAALVAKRDAKLAELAARGFGGVLVVLIDALSPSERFEESGTFHAWTLEDGEGRPMLGTDSGLRASGPLGKVAAELAEPRDPTPPARRRTKPKARPATKGKRGRYAN